MPRAGACSCSASSPAGGARARGASRSRLFIAGFRADELILETGNQLARSDLDRHVLAGAAVEGGSPDAAREVDDDLVAGRGLLRFRRIVEALHRSEEHTSELQSLMRISYAVFCLEKKKTNN